MRRPNPFKLTTGLLLIVATSGCDQPMEPTGAADDLVSPAFTTIVTGGAYEMTVLGTLGGNMGQAWGINDHGQVVGRSVTAAHPTGPHHAFLWEDGLWTDLFPGGTSQAFGVNEQGQVVGVWRSTTTYNAALWERTAPGEEWTHSDLGSLEGNALTEAWDINDHGEVVGHALEVLGQAYTQSPFYWADGVFTPLEMPGEWALATAINNEGQIVGYGATAEGTGSAFLWEDPWSTPIPLTGLGQAWDINDHGQVVGGNAVWENGTLIYLGGLGSNEPSDARGINNLGEVVGSSSISGVPHAFHWKDGVMTDLGVLPGDKSVARDINDQGQVVGYGWTLSGADSYALLWSVSDPGSTEPGLDVEVTPDDETTGEPAPTAIIFDEVTESGETTVASSTIGDPDAPPAPSTANFRLGQPPTFFDIETTATFAGSVEICIDYATVSYGNENQLKLLHFDQSSGTWEDVTTSLDTVNDVICGETSSLSPFLVAETNLAPVLHSITLPGDPVSVGTTVPATATFSDDNPTDAHTAVLDWGEASVPGTVSGSGGSGTVSGSFTYTLPGVYTVQVTVSDGDLSGNRSSALDEPSFVVVYDPDGGFVTGGGWIMSPVGAYVPDPTLSGKATFGFVSKYKKGATLPTGNTEFHFQAGELNFHSDQYDWLVVNQNGANAQFKGSGTINGSGNFNFMVWAGDGDPDTFRIKLWEEVGEGGETVIYDNGFNQSIGGGSIVIQAR